MRRIILLIFICVTSCRTYRDAIDFNIIEAPKYFIEILKDYNKLNCNSKLFLVADNEKEYPQHFVMDFPNNFLEIRLVNNILCIYYPNSQKIIIDSEYTEKTNFK